VYTKKHKLKVDTCLLYLELSFSLPFLSPVSRMLGQYYIETTRNYFIPFYSS